MVRGGRSESVVRVKDPPLAIASPIDDPVLNHCLSPERIAFPIAGS